MLKEPGIWGPALGQPVDRTHHVGRSCPAGPELPARTGPGVARTGRIQMCLLAMEIVHNLKTFVVGLAGMELERPKIGLAGMYRLKYPEICRYNDFT